MDAFLPTAVITAVSGLGGVALGAWATGRHQREERRQERIREQLDGFYGPMLGLRAWIRATSELRPELSRAADNAWKKLVRRRDHDVDLLRELQQERFPDFEQVVEENNRQFAEEILPRYEAMITAFSENLSLAEKSTRKHFPTLVKFVELWRRWLDDTIPAEALQELGHSEEELFPLYADLREQFERLQKELKE